MLPSFRRLPTLCPQAGGDLDGDEYFVISDPAIVGAVTCLVPSLVPDLVPGLVPGLEPGLEPGLGFGTTPADATSQLDPSLDSSLDSSDANVNHCINPRCHAGDETPGSSEISSISSAE